MAQAFLTPFLPPVFGSGIPVGGEEVAVQVNPKAVGSCRHRIWIANDPEKTVRIHERCNDNVNSKLFVKFWFFLQQSRKPEGNGNWRQFVGVDSAKKQCGFFT